MSGTRGLSTTLICLLALLAAACTSSPGPTGPLGPRPTENHPIWPPPPTLRPVPTAAPTATRGAFATPYRDVTFEDVGVNGFVDPARDPLSTFAMDVDTASYGVARRFIDDGSLPPRDAIRLEEFVNAFDYGYPSPVDGAFSVYVDGGPTPFTDRRTTLVRIGIQARRVSEEERAPASLTFVIDTSGSMGMENRIELVKDALSILVDSLHANDSVAIVEFGTDARVVLNPTSAAEPQVILDAIGRLTAQGTTNAQAGLELGFDLAALGHRPGAIDRVVLASDGVANVGLTDADALLARIDREVQAGVDLVTVGVGMGNFNDVLLEQLANRGNGFYSYINDRRDADRLFRQQLTGTLQVVARDAKVQVEFRPETVARYRLLGYENRGLADDDFRDPYVDAGEVGAGHSVTALYEVELLDGRALDGFLGTVRLRWQDPDTRQESDLIAHIELADTYRDWDSADLSFRLAATVAGMAEILRDSPFSRHFTLADVADEADILARLLFDHPDVVEFAVLADRAARLGR